MVCNFILGSLGVVSKGFLGDWPHFSILGQLGQWFKVRTQNAVLPGSCGVGGDLGQDGLCWRPPGPHPAAQRGLQGSTPKYWGAHIILGNQPNPATWEVYPWAPELSLSSPAIFFFRMLLYAFSVKVIIGHREIGKFLSFLFLKELERVSRNGWTSSLVNVYESEILFGGRFF